MNTPAVTVEAPSPDPWSAALEASHAASEATQAAVGASWDTDDIHATGGGAGAEITLASHAADLWTTAAKRAFAAAFAYRAAACGQAWADAGVNIALKRRKGAPE